MVHQMNTVKLRFNEIPRSKQKYLLKASSRYFHFSSSSFIKNWDLKKSGYSKALVIFIAVKYEAPLY
jgi:hypothetical protein